jgi:hypothetical protein
MKMPKNILLTTFLALTIITIFSCKKFVDIEPSPDLIDTDEIFENDATAVSAINGAYIKMRSFSLSLTNGGLSVYTGLSSDELFNTAASTTYDPFFRDSIPVENNTVLRNFWTEPYSNIYRLNAIIEGLSRSSSLTDSLKHQLSGEAKYMRSLYYFYLANIFGDVPLILTSSYESNQTMPRTPVAQIYQFITNDLLEAEGLLSPSYQGTGKIRINKWAATALLARLYLFQQNWTLAETKASVVINSGYYSLASNIANVFLKNSPETIFEIAPSNESGNTAEGATFIPTSATTRPPLALTASLLNSFEASDKRKINWAKSNTVSAVTYFYPYKYKVKSSTSVTEYLIVQRLAELYLIRAEARAQSGNLTNAAADINTIRARAGLPNTIATTQPALLLAIESERQTELFCEWGHRWLDLKRTGRLNTVLSAVKPYWRSFAALYPIPFSQLQLNVYLMQNSGY